MKIIFLTDQFPPTGRGGAENIVYRDALALAGFGHEIVVVTTTANRREMGVNHESGLKIYRFYSPDRPRWRSLIGLWNPPAIKFFRQICRIEKPEIIHLHNIHSHFSFAILKTAQNSGAKIFLTLHDAMSFHYGKLSADFELRGRKENWQSQLKAYRFRFLPGRRFFISYFLKSTKPAVFAVSEALAEACRAHGVPVSGVLHNGIDTADWNPDLVAETNLKEKLGLSNAGKIIFFAGRLSGAKGGFQALKALTLVCQKIPAAKLLVAGDASGLGKGFKNMITDLKLSSAVIFTGWLSPDEMKQAYKLAAVILVPSLYLDPFPTINLEAMAMKKPVVGTNFGGTKEIIQTGVTGFLVDPFDQQEIASAVVDLLSDSEKARSFGFAGRRRVEEFFSQTKHLEKLLDLYNNTKSI